MKQVWISQYYGQIYVRVYDTNLKKNIGKISPSELEKYLSDKVNKNKLKVVEYKNKNTLSDYIIK